MVSVSGIRGIVGSSLTPRVIEKYISAFCHLQRKSSPNRTVILGRDSRVSGPWITKIVEAILIAMGFKVLECGIVPTPTVQFIVLQEKAVGGVIITSSHNPIEWNGLKFVDSDGLFFSPEKCTELFKIADMPGEIQWPSWKEAGSVVDYPDAISRHIQALLDLKEVNKEKVVKKKYKVVLDAVNGAGGPIMKQLLETFGCEVVGLNLEPTGIFGHTPEPVPENLGDLCKAVLEHKADFGVAVDPDVDRCVFIDETGKPIGEEYTLAMAFQYWLGVCQKRGPTCKNLSSSRVLDDIAKQYGCQIYASPVGEIHVAKKMIEVGAVIGGEGNGGVMLPDLHIGRDAPVAATLALQLLAGFNGTLSQLKGSLPQWYIIKKKASVVGIDPEKIIEEVTKEWQAKGARINTSDGVRIETEEWWVHIRKSNTEPIVRVIGEARSEPEADLIVSQFAVKIGK
uniref:Phosphoglucosamine mutase n=1 Tax=Arcella intermedia TaxID=1963864 RepID=A0A6B2L3J2_9EUKA